VNIKNMPTISFFNHFHNGDLFASKGYIKDIILQLSEYFDFQYIHMNHSKVLEDLKIKYVYMDEKLRNQLNQNQTIFNQSDSDFFINTWIGPHLFSECSKPNQNTRGLGCNWRMYHDFFSEIYSFFNEQFFEKNKILKDKLILKPIEYYFPEIDYSYYELDNVSKFLINLDHNKTKILISNGKALSGQTDGIDSFNVVYEMLAKNFPQKYFFFTYRFESQLKNIFFTDDIIKSSKIGNAHLNQDNKSICDLNEIAYLSTLCEFIIGANSGPFIFTHTKQNIMNANKKILAYGNNEYDCLTSWLNVPSKIIHIYRPDENMMFSKCMELINN